MLHQSPDAKLVELSTLKYASPTSPEAESFVSCVGELPVAKKLAPASALTFNLFLRLSFHPFLTL
jgi:hypothetical protein